jgi:hypothetical protein
MNQESMIGNDGGLRVPAKRVTWFQFLQLSRVTNSKLAGWNSWKHWKERGLNILAEPKILHAWTANSISLAKNARPTPRHSDFMFDRQFSESRKAVKKGSENFLNAKLFASGTRFPGSGEIIGYEIPLAAEAEGQLKIDLFGFGEGVDGGFVSIIELKKAGNKSDSPLLALTETICYGIQMIRCKNYLLKDKVLQNKGIGGAHLNNIHLILAAPEAYWEHWAGKDWAGGEIENRMRGIVSSVSNALGQGHTFSLCPYAECAKEVTRIAVGNN